MKKSFAVLLFCLLGFAAKAQFGYSIGSVDCSTSMNPSFGSQKVEGRLGLFPSVSMQCSGSPSDYYYDLGTEVQVSIDYSSSIPQCYYKANNALNQMTKVASIPSTFDTIGSYWYDYYELKSTCGSKVLFEVYRSRNNNLISIKVYTHYLVIEGSGCR
jgi:hypothetical protein